MKVVAKDTLTIAEKEIICTLWNAEYPQQLGHQNISEFDNYLHNLSEATHYLLIDENEQIKGWGISFWRDNEIWFAIILDEKIHGKGFGTLLLNELKKAEIELNGWVVDHENDIKQDGEKYKSPLAFYSKNDFTVCKEIRLETAKISAVKIKWRRN